MDLPRIGRKYGHVTVEATVAGGLDAVLSGIDVALLPPGEAPNATTQWTPTSYKDGVGTILLAGPEADPTGALPVSADLAHVFARVVDGAEVDVALIGIVRVV